MRLEGEVLFKTHPHSSTEISFIRLRVRQRFWLGDMVRGSTADTPAGNNHIGVVVGRGCRSPVAPSHVARVMILLFLITYLQFNY
jgi:hypothetical protein